MLRCASFPVSRMPVCVSARSRSSCRTRGGVMSGAWRTGRQLAGSASPWSTVCVGTRRPESTARESDKRICIWARPACMGGRRGALSGPVAFPTMFGVFAKSKPSPKPWPRAQRRGGPPPSAARRSSRLKRRVRAGAARGAFRAACASSFSVLHPRRSWALRARPPGTSAERAGPAGPRRHRAPGRRRGSERDGGAVRCLPVRP